MNSHNVTLFILISNIKFSDLKPRWQCLLFYTNWSFNYFTFTPNSSLLGFSPLDEFQLGLQAAKVNHIHACNPNTRLIRKNSRIKTNLKQIALNYQTSAYRSFDQWFEWRRLLILEYMIGCNCKLQMLTMCKRHAMSISICSNNNDFRATYSVIL